MKRLVALSAACLTFTATAATPYHSESVMLLQPDSVLQERVPSVDALANYIKAVQATSDQALSGQAPSPTGGYLVLAVRPGGQSMVWLDFKPALPAPTAAKLRAAILAVPAFEAQNGVVVIALNSSLWGAPASSTFTSPQEWTDAMRGHDGPMEVGELVDKVWPGRPGT